MTSSSSPETTRALRPAKAAKASAPTEAAEQRTTTLRDLLAPVRSMLIGVFLAGVVASAFTLMSPIAVTHLAAGALDKSLTPTAAWAWLTALALSFILAHIIAVSATGHAHVVESAYRHQLRSRIARHIGRLPLGWFSSESSGRVRTIISEDVTQIHTIIAHTGVDLGQALGGTILGLIYLFTLSWQYALLLLVWVAISCAIMFAGIVLSPASSIEEYTEAEKALASSTIEMVDGIATVKAFGMSSTLFRRFSEAIDRYTTASHEWMKGPGRPLALALTLLSPSGMLIPLLGGAWFLSRLHVIDPLLLVPFLLVGISLPSGLTRTMSLMHLVVRGNDAAARIGALLDIPVLPEPEEPCQIDEDVPADIVLEDVTFQYSPDAPPALSGVSATFAAGTVTAVVGPSGSGKSTLVKLIARFWDVTSGRILLSGVPITDLSTPDLLSRLAVVLQEGGLLSATVEENIRLGRPQAHRSDVEEAAKRARIHERIMALPDGYDSVVGTDGTHFSGGEAQRIALARAFLGDAPVLLLDEATAQADPHSERRIQEALGALSRGRTTIVIAHRLATIVDADQILVLSGGRIVERGRHEELLARAGMYAKMWEAQQ